MFAGFANEIENCVKIIMFLLKSTPNIQNKLNKQKENRTENTHVK
jgi:hypothetical protein